MKKKANCVAALLMAVMLVCGCTQHAHIYKIGVAQCSSGPWREKVNQEMLAAQHLYEQDVEVVIAQSYDDSELQIRQIDSLARSGIDLLVVAPNETMPLAKAIAAVRKQGIPVIFFDRKAGTDDYTAFIGGNNIEAGQAVGEYALSMAKGLVLEVTGSMSTSPAQERHKGFAQAMENGGKQDYICREGDWTSEEACRIVTEQINTGHKPDIVFCHNDGMATGAYKATVETGCEGDIKILGIDGMPDEGLDYVQLGHQIGTYIYPTHGEKIVRLALDILTGKPHKKENPLRGMLVTPENVDPIAATASELLEQNGHLVIIQNKLEKYLGINHILQKVIAGGVMTIVLLLAALALMWRAWTQTRRTIRQRQAMNEEQTLFYTDASSRKLHDIFDRPDDDLPQPRTQDVIFAEQLNDAIRKHMGNANLKMDELGDELGLSRVQLYRKVKAITGQTPVELLRQMRLQRAYALLGGTNKTVAEVAYEVGFGTPGYFSKCFKQQYGKYPTDLRTEKPQ